ncbi:hypothetical protein AGLY_005240, partial [Aphis glycines]
HNKISNWKQVAHKSPVSRNYDFNYTINIFKQSIFIYLHKKKKTICIGIKKNYMAKYYEFICFLAKLLTTHSSNARQIDIPTIGHPKRTTEIPPKNDKDALIFCLWKKNFKTVNHSTNYTLTLPIAKSPLSNNNNMPKNRNDIPKPARPTPISVGKKLIVLDTIQCYIRQTCSHTLEKLILIFSSYSTTRFKFDNIFDKI